MSSKSKAKVPAKKAPAKKAPAKKPAEAAPPASAQARASSQQKLDLLFQLSQQAPVAAKQHVLAQQCYSELSASFR